MSNIITTAKKQIEPDEMYKPKELVEASPVIKKIYSMATIYRLLRKGDIPSTNVSAGKKEARYLVKGEDFIKYLEQMN